MSGDVVEGRQSRGRLTTGLAIAVAIVSLGIYVSVDGARDGFAWYDGALLAFALVAAAFFLAEWTWRMTIDHEKATLVVGKWPFRTKEYRASQIESLTECSLRQWTARVDDHVGVLTLYIGRLHSPDSVAAELHRFADENRLTVTETPASDWS